MESEKCRGFCGQNLDFQVSTQKRSELLRGVHRIQQYEKSTPLKRQNSGQKPKRTKSLVLLRFQKFCPGSESDKQI